MIASVSTSSRYSVRAGVASAYGKGSATAAVIWAASPTAAPSSTAVRRCSAARSSCSSTRLVTWTCSADGWAARRTSALKVRSRAGGVGSSLSSAARGLRGAAAAPRLPAAPSASPDPAPLPGMDGPASVMAENVGPAGFRAARLAGPASDDDSRDRGW